MDFAAGILDSITGIFSGLGSLNFETIAQLTMLALIVISGPLVIVVLSAKGGDL
jgi:hypothetical protein